MLRVWTILALLVVVFVGVGAYEWIAAARRTELRASLHAVLDLTHQALGRWHDEQARHASAWATSPDVVVLVEKLLQAPPTPEGLLASSARPPLDEILGTVLIAEGYAGYHIIGPGDISLASSRMESVGTTNPLSTQPAVLQRLWQGMRTLSATQESDVPMLDVDGVMRSGSPVIFAGAPIRNRAGKVIALLMFRIRPSLDFTATLQHGRIGMTGETYSFDSRGRMTSESRFDHLLREIELIRPGERGILNVELRDPGRELGSGEAGNLERDSLPLTTMAASALAGESGSNVGGYRDYRGVEVAGAWMWDEDQNLGIATEIDIAEAYGALNRSAVGIAVVCGIAMLLIVGLALTYRQNRQRALLETGLAKVLSGYIPICASCKMIRDDRGKWQPVENYVSDRTDAHFSHSICPKCGKKLYGDLYHEEH